MLTYCRNAHRFMQTLVNSQPRTHARCTITSYTSLTTYRRTVQTHACAPTDTETHLHTLYFSELTGVAKSTRNRAECLSRNHS